MQLPHRARTHLVGRCCRSSIDGATFGARSSRVLLDSARQLPALRVRPRPLPQAQFHVLVALTAGERHGYAIMQAVEESSSGVVRMGPATLYGTLKKLIDQGLAEELAHRPSRSDDQRRRWTILSTFLTVVGTTAMFGALIFFVIGLLTPRVDLDSSGRA